jgi:FkbM family methyltransferase
MTKNEILYQKNFGFKEIINKFFIFLINCLIKFKRMISYSNKIHNQEIAGFIDDHITNIINIDGLYERKELETFQEFLKKISPKFKYLKAIDVGANIGNHSIFFSQFFETVHAIEANPISYDVLKLNSKKINNINPINIAITEKNKTVYLRQKKKNISGSNLEKKYNKNFIKIKAKSLDNLFFNKKNITLIKIDVEGHELEVIKGAKRLITRNKPIIVFEHHLQNFKKGQSPTINFLKKNGYNKFAVVKPFYMISYNDNFLIKIIKNLKQIFFYKMKYVVQLNEHIVPDYYSFIIAIPTKFDIRD